MGKKNSEKVVARNICSKITENQKKYLLKIIPEDLFRTIVCSFKEGFKSSVDKTVKEYLKSQNYTSEQMYWIELAVHALVLFGMGVSIRTQTEVMLANYVFTHVFGLSNEMANNITNRIVIGLSVETSSKPWQESAEITASITGRKVGIYLTKMAMGLYNHSVFAAKKDGMKGPDVANAAIMLTTML
jgi:CRISPR/Cas system CSM-associated protein Csm5 (group 7 of RAMP superfamily)